MKITSFLLSSLVVVACAACEPTLPPHFAESTEVLSPGGVSLTAVGGGGGVATHAEQGGGNGGQGLFGGEARLRVGVGGRQEVGASGFLVAAPGNGSSGGGPVLLGGKLSYKIAPIRRLALVASAGAFSDGESPPNAVFGGDLGVLFAPYIAPDGTQIYTGARGSFVVPVLTHAHGSSESVSAPLGVAFHVSEAVRFFVEGGLVLGLGQFRDLVPPNDDADIQALGGYGVVAAQFILR